MTEEETQYLTEFEETYFDFEMFSSSGNQKVKDLITEVIISIFNEKKINLKGILDYLKRLISEACNGKKGFREIKDTEPLIHIHDHTNMALEFKGYKFKVNRFQL
tara:strand:- start:296 stop:610 length:315 start_codon:yes stop_codon:yes gene_type:complete